MLNMRSVNRAVAPARECSAKDPKTCERCCWVCGRDATERAAEVSVEAVQEEEYKQDENH